MSKKVSESTILRKNIKLYLQDIGYDSELISKLERRFNKAAQAKIDIVSDKVG